MEKVCRIWCHFSLWLIKFNIKSSNNGDKYISFDYQQIKSTLFSVIYGLALNNTFANLSCKINRYACVHCNYLVSNTFYTEKTTDG